ncbi:hypothetical protein [Methylobacterium marchantiae]|uniref:Uncharacterized protein n=1 Tax=Methylobacterium marchantiae TaxID=600331 RepID=A0ABW3X297_9HYPH|nr:hypothetical protein AIGOOFII_1199 [Methylobacterium marchantiae]
MSRLATYEHESAAIRSDLAGIAVEVELVRVERVLARKYSPDQPREPAGQSGGGRWTSGALGDDGSADPETTGSLGSDTSPDSEETITEDGSRVLSLRIRSHPSQGWDEQHTVIAPDGTRTVFEMEGRTQTIRDGETGEILSRSTMVDGRAVPEAFAQNARASRPSPSRHKAAVEAALALLSVFALRKSRDGKAIFDAPASAYEPGPDPNYPAMWVGRVDQQELDAACPRRGEVQEILDESVAQARGTGDFMDAQDFGNRVHAIAAGKIRALHDQNLVPEVSYIYGAEEPVPYGTKFSLRLDALERSVPSTVCVHDHKTGESGFTALRAASIAAMVARNFPGTQRTS